MRRALLFAALAAGSSGAWAQTTNCQYGQPCGLYTAYAGTARDGLINQVVLNTYCAAQIRLDSDGCVGVAANEASAALNRAIARFGANGIVAPKGPNVAQASWTWQQVIRGLSVALPFPYQLGGYNPVGNGFDGNNGSYGGGGATVTLNSCEDLQLAFDAEGNLIIPSYWLQVGQPIPFGTYFASQNNSAPGALGTKTIGDSWQSRARRVVHLWNMTRAEPDWYGVVGPMQDGTIQFATVAFRWGNGAVAARSSTSLIGTGSLDGPHGNTSPQQDPYDHGASSPIVHQPCPQVPVPGAHYYGYTDWSGPHLHSCIAFIPQDNFGWSGYALNKRTTLPFPTSGWPNANVPNHLRACPLSPELLAKWTNAFWKNAADNADTIKPHSQDVITADARTNDARVADLGDNPVTGSQPATSNGGETSPPVTQPGGGTTTPTTINVNVDFGPDPGTSISDPEAPTGIMDPVFDWLPDLPSLTFPDIGSECPVWNVDLRSFGGADWQWVMDSHCDIAEQNRAAIGALMLAIWGIAAALVILRA